MTECVVCSTEVENIETRNGEMMCENCYIGEDNQVFEE